MECMRLLDWFLKFEIWQEIRDYRTWRQLVSEDERRQSKGRGYDFLLMR